MAELSQEEKDTLKALINDTCLENVLDTLWVICSERADYHSARNEFDKRDSWSRLSHKIAAVAGYAAGLGV